MSKGTGRAMQIKRDGGKSGFYQTHSITPEGLAPSSQITPVPVQIVEETEITPVIATDNISVSGNSYVENIDQEVNINTELINASESTYIENIKSDSNIGINVATSESTYTEFNPQNSNIPDTISNSPDSYIENISQDKILDSNIIESRSTIIETNSNIPSINIEVSNSSDTYKELEVKVSNIPSEISNSQDNYIENIKSNSDINIEVSTSQDNYKELEVKQSNIPNNIPASQDNYKELEVKQSNIPNNIPASPDTYKEFILQSSSIPNEIPTSKDNFIENIEIKPSISNELQISNDTYREFTYNPLNIPSEISTSKDSYIEISHNNLQISPEILTSQDTYKEFISGKNSILPSPDGIFVAPEDSYKYQRREFIFAKGKWMPSNDPLTIGDENFQTLQNLRYMDDGLEGIDGFSRINTTVTGKYMKNGIQLRTNYSQESYVLVQGEASTGYSRVIMTHIEDIPGTGDFTVIADGVITITLSSNDTLIVHSHRTSPSGDSGARTIVVTAGTTYNTTTLCDAIQTALNADTTLTFTNTVLFTVNYINGHFSITANGGTIQYVDTGSTIGDTIGFNADIALAATITGQLHIVPSLAESNGSNAGRARFSLLPQSHVGICDTDNNYIWAGDEMPIGAFFGVVNSGADLGPSNSNVYSDYTNIINNILTDTTNSVTMQSWYYGYNFYYIMTTRPARGFNLTLTNNADSTYFQTAYNVLKFKYDGGGSTSVTITSGLTPNEWHTTTEMAAALEAAIDLAFTITSTVTFNTVTGAYDITVDGGHTIQYINTASTGGMYYGFNADSSAAVSISSTIDPCKIKIDYWDGSAFSNANISMDSTQSGGKSLQQSGKLALWSYGALTPVPVFVNGYYLYCYVLRVWNGKATIHNITADCPIQTVKDIWDGQLRTPISCVVYRGAAQDDYSNNLESAYDDYTLEVAEQSYYANPIGAGLGGINTTDNMIVMFRERMAAIHIGVSANHYNAANVTTTVSYYNGSTWTACTIIDETLNGSASFYKSGFISWHNVSESSEVLYTYRGVTGYAYKFTWSAKMTEFTKASIIMDDKRKSVLVDTIGGVTAYKSIDKTYTFPVLYRDRAFWCNCLSDNSWNRIDYSSKYRPDVYNGEDSSGRFNERSLYFGTNTPLTAGVELYNQYADSLDSIGLFFKANETYVLTGDNPTEFKINKVSGSIGCPAPLTLDAAEVTIGKVDAPKQNVAIWLSDKGPMLFSNGSIIPIADNSINKYFIGSDTSYLMNTSYIYLAAGIYDHEYNEYHLLIPGNAQTANTIWLVYDLARGKWHENNIGTSTDFPQAFIRVVDNNGNKYIYALTNTGYMLRINNTRYWSTSSNIDITYTIKTADILPTSSAWDWTHVTGLESIFTANTEGKIVIKYYPNGYTTAVTVSDYPVLINGTNCSMYFKYDAIDTTLCSLTYTGTTYYSASELASMLQTSINTTFSASSSVSFSTSTGKFTITVTGHTIQYIDASSTAGDYFGFTTNSTKTETITSDSVSSLVYKTMANSSYRTRHLLTHLNKTSWSHAFEFVMNTCTVSKPKLLAWALRYLPEREDMLDKTEMS